MGPEFTTQDASATATTRARHFLPDKLISWGFSERLHYKKGPRMFRRLIATSSTWITFPLRLGLAAVFLGHGAQKVLGSFGGKGLSVFVSGPTPFPFMRPAWLWLGTAALSELVGAVLILLGFLTRVGAFFIACVMITAVVGVHWPNFFAPQGFEYPMMLLAACLALLIAGGGQLSVDLGLTGARGRRR